MAPSNLNQVFVVNNPNMYDSPVDFSNITSANATIMGLWDVDAAAYDDDAAITSKKRIQIVQTMPSGNPIATPIIDVKDIKRIKYTPFTATQRHQVAATFSAAVPTGETYMVKIALRNAPTAYANYYQNGTAVDISGGGYEFPLEGNFSAGRTIMPIVEIAAGTSAANCGIAVTNAITNNSRFNKLFTASDNGSGVVTILARHAGVVFDLVAFNTVTNTNVIGTPTVTGFAAGAGNYWQALSDEKAQRARYGNFNRMYFPMNFDKFAVSTWKYDVIEISYEHAWPSSTGIARAGELNNIKIYVGGSSTALTYLAEATGTNLQTVFGYTFGTTSTYEQVF